MADERTVELISVTKRFGTTVAMDSVNLKIPGGAYCCLLGPSGCGKTTTLRMIAGHEIVSSGVTDQQFDRNPVRIGDAVAAMWAAGDVRLLQAA